MRKKNKKIISILALGIFMTLTPGNAMAAAGSDTGEMDLEQVIENTISGNSSLNLYNKKIDVAKTALEEADLQTGEETDYQQEMRLSVNPGRRQLELDNLNWDKDQKQDSVVTKSKQLYFQYIIQDKLIEIQKDKIQTLKTALQNKKTGIDVGTEAQNSLIDDQVNLDTAETELQQLLNDKESIRMKLNINMGKSVNSVLNLKSEDIPYEEYTLEDVGAIAEKMSKECHSVTSMNKELELDRTEEGIAEMYDDDENQLERAAYPNTDYKSYAETLSDTITNLEYQVIDEENSVNAKVRIDYNNILSLNNTVTSKKLDYDQAVILYNTEKSKLEVGMSTQLQVDTAEESMKEAECQYNEAKIDYLTAVEQFKSYIKDFN
ncbi:MAG: TolC family protein [Solirubrobacterales bacterium]